jgi:hypothetical protein
MVRDYEAQPLPNISSSHFQEVLGGELVDEEDVKRRTAALMKLLQLCD